MIRLLLFATILFAPLTSTAEVLFEDNFDNSPDWTSKQQTTDIAWPSTWGVADGGSCTTYCPPQNWTTYRNSASHISTPPGEDTYQIGAEFARGGTGKGFGYYHEATGAWADGAGLEKFVIPGGGVGVKEIYVAYWEQWPAWLWSHGDQHKEISLSSNTITPSASNKFDSRGSLYWITMDAFMGYYQNDSFQASTPYADPALRLAPRYDSEYISNCNYANTSVLFPTDQAWHHYELHVKLNSAPGVADGVYEFYLDGDKKTAVSCTNIPWVQSYQWESKGHYGTYIGGAITPTSQMKGYRVISISGENFTIKAGVNDTLKFKYDSGVITSVTIPAGDYTGTSLASVVSTACSSALGATVTCTWDNVTRFFTFSVNTGHTIQWVGYANGYMTFGFYNKSSTSASESIHSHVMAGGRTGFNEPDWLNDCPNKGDTCVDGEVTWEMFSDFAWTNVGIHDNFITSYNYNVELGPIKVDDVVISTEYIGPNYVIGGSTPRTLKLPPGLAKQITGTGRFIQ